MRKVLVQYSVAGEPMRYVTSRYTGARRAFDMPGKSWAEFVSLLKSNAVIPSDAKRIKIVNAPGDKKWFAFLKLHT